MTKTKNRVGWLFAAGFALTAPLAYLTPLGLAPLVGVVGLGCLAFDRPSPPRAALIGLGDLVLWAGLSMVWSPARPWLAAQGLMSAVDHVTLLQIATFALLALLAAASALKLDAGASGRIVGVLGWSILALAAILAVDSAARGKVYAGLAALVQSSGPVDYSKVWAARGGYVLAVLMWPWTASLSRRARWFLPAPFLGVAAVTLLLGQDAPLMALIVGSAAFVLTFAWGTRGLVALGAAQAAFWLGAPWAVHLVVSTVGARTAQSAIKPSWTERLRIWRFASDRVMEHPWRGLGMDASRTFGDQIPLHPHDWSLQIWLELGLPGAVLVTGLWLGLLRCVQDLRRPAQRAAAAAGLSAYLAIGAVSFGIWQTWWLAVGVLAILAQIAVSRRDVA